MRSPVLPFSPRPLPAYSTRLVGRDAELAALSDPDVCGLVTLVGPGGVGKTRLAVEIARASRAPSVFVDASSARDAAALVRALLRDLGSVDPLYLAPMEEVVERICGGGWGLVLLDNLEQLGGEAIAVVERLREIAGLRVFCTSRRAIGARGEQVYPVATLSPDAAAELFVRALPLAGPARAGVDLGQPEVLDLVEALEYNPLAIELAAGRTAVLPLGEVLRQIREAPAIALRDPSRPAGRGSDLALSVAWSCDLLPPEARLGLAHAAAFAGAFDLEAARAVIAPPGGADAALEVLIAWHLVRAVGSDRFALYQAVRSFMVATFAAEIEPALERHGLFYLARVAKVADSYASAVPLLDDAAEIDSIYERGLAEGASASRLAISRRTAAKAHRLEILRRGPGEHRALAERLIGAGRVDDDVLPLLADAGLMSLHLWDIEAARERLEALRSLAKERGKPSMEGLALLQLANVAQIEGRLDAISALTDRALELARQAADPFLEVWALGGVALNVAFQEGDYTFVAERVDRALAVARSLSPDLTARMLFQRIGVDLAVRDWAAARGRIEEIHEMDRREGRISWFRREMLARIEMLALIGEHGPTCVDQVVARLEGIDEARSAHLSILAGFAERLAGRGSERLLRGRDALEGVPNLDDRLRLSAVVAAGLALDGHDLPLDGLAASTPSARAVLDLARCAQGVASRRLLPDAASRVAFEPPSAWTNVLAWALDAALAQRRAEAQTWEVSAGGAWFRAPGGPRVDLSRRPRLARLVDALAERGALQVAEMFAAGWPGEHARADAQANRVRVAVAELRRLGLEILLWRRERGWFLGADVKKI